MKKKSLKYYLLIVGPFIFFIMSNSCKYKRIVDIPYPDQKIYLPAAIDGVFKINEKPEPRGNTPVPGFPYRYLIDSSNNLFIVPLAVYRSGIDNNGAISVNISINEDTIRELKAKGVLSKDVHILTPKEYELPTDIIVKNREEIASFDLKVDLQFLKENIGKDYALGISIFSNSRETNPKLSTAIILIDTDILKP